MLEHKISTIFEEPKNTLTVGLKYARL